MKRAAIMAEGVPLRPATELGAAVRIDGFTRRFGPVVAVDAVSLDIAAGEFLALLGPSGSGKSTILMGIAGFEYPDAGRVEIGGADCTALPANRRNLGMVFQKYTLFPHLSVLDNVAFPLKMRGMPRRERHRLAAQALETVRLGGYGARMPAQLSGGQQQRVALARAIVYNPPVLLMDEPLSALDRNLREEMQLEIKRLHAGLGMTMVFVTHDQGEALTMADRVAVLNEGRVQQIGTPRALYERPETLFVARFIGEMNFLPCRLDAAADATAVVLGDGRRWALPRSALVGAPAAGGPATLAIRPERLEVVAPADAPDTLPARVEDVVYAGAAQLVIARLPDGTEMRARLPGHDRAGQARPGAAIGLRCPPEAVLVYPGSAPR